MTEADQLMFKAMGPVFERHFVPQADRLFLFRAFDRLIEDDCENLTIAGAVESGILGADTYEKLLQEQCRGHRWNRAWFRSAAFADAVPTRRARILFRDLVAVTPAWQDPVEPARPPRTQLRAVGSFG